MTYIMEFKYNLHIWYITKTGAKLQCYLDNKPVINWSFTCQKRSINVTYWSHLHRNIIKPGLWSHASKLPIAGKKLNIKITKWKSEHGLFEFFQK